MMLVFNAVILAIIISILVISHNWRIKNKHDPDVLMYYHYYVDSKISKNETLW